MNSLFLNFIHKVNDFLLIYTDVSKNLSFSLSLSLDQLFGVPVRNIVKFLNFHLFSWMLRPKALHYIIIIPEYTKFLICADSLSILKAINGFSINKNPRL